MSNCYIENCRNDECKKMGQINRFGSVKAYCCIHYQNNKHRYENNPGFEFKDYCFNCQKTVIMNNYRENICQLLDCSLCLTNIQECDKITDMIQSLNEAWDNLPPIKDEELPKELQSKPINKLKCLDCQNIIETKEIGIKDHHFCNKCYGTNLSIW